jgi:aspartate kinase
MLNAEVIEIWTDVSGIKTADPRVVPTAYTQKDMSFKEAAELAYFGAKVLHPSTLLPAMGKNIPVLVKNTMAPEDLGTTITSQSVRPGIIKALAFRKDIVVMTIESTRMLMAYGFLEKIFDVFARYKIAVDLISTSEISVSLTIDKSQYDPAIVKELSSFARVNVSDQQSIISLVGENIKAYPNFLKKTFQAVDSTKVEMISFGASNVNLSIVTAQSYTNEAVLQLHKIFFEN